MLNVVKMLLKREVDGSELNSHGNYIVDHGKSWKNHGIVFLNFYGNPKLNSIMYSPIHEKHNTIYCHCFTVNWWLDVFINKCSK